MKKVFKSIGMIALIAVIGLSVVACKQEVDEFEGTWTANVDIGNGVTIIQTIIFAGNTFTVLMNGENFSKGTFTFTDTTVSVTPTHEWDETQWILSTTQNTETSNYTLTGNTLVIKGNSDITYTRK
jgi:hypothetical protein